MCAILVLIVLTSLSTSIDVHCLHSYHKIVFDLVEFDVTLSIGLSKHAILDNVGPAYHPGVGHLHQINTCCSEPL